MKAFKVMLLAASLFVADQNIICATVSNIAITERSSKHDADIFALLYGNRSLLFPVGHPLTQSTMNAELFTQEINQAFEQTGDTHIMKTVTLNDQFIGFVSYYQSKEKSIAGFYPNATDREKEEILAFSTHLRKADQPIREYIELDLICLKEEYRGQGFGTIVLDKIIQDAKIRWPNAQILKLDVVPTNTKALQFYKRQGFYENENSYLCASQPLMHLEKNI